MRDGRIERRKFVLKTVAFPTSCAARRVQRTTAAGDVVVSKHTRPHDVGTRIVIFGVIQDARRRRHKRADEACCDVVRHTNGPNAREPTLADVSDHVGHARRRLVRRKRERDFGVHERDHRTERIAIRAAFRVNLVIADHSTSLTPQNPPPEW